MNNGFSLIELIVTIAIVTAVGAIGVSTYQTAHKANEPAQASLILADALKQAILHAKVMDRDTDWGVNITDTDITIFGGPDYQSRTKELDSVVDIPGGLSIEGPDQIVFAKFSGEPSVVDTVTFSNDYASKSVAVTAGGTIEY